MDLQSIIDESEKIVFFGGAGVSTESGIPDFRSQDGLYNMKYKYPPEQIISHSFFMADPEEFFRFYRDRMIYPAAKPNAAHLKLAELERAGKLSAVVTQNIDGLHSDAGSKNVIELHGSVRRNHCMKCGKSYGLEFITSADGVPRCSCGGIVKPDVDCCATRLRVTVNDPGLVSEDLLKESGASGVIRKGNGVQVVYGPQVSVVRSDLEAFIDSPASDDPDSIIGALPQTAEPETAPAGSAPTVLYAHMTGKAVPLEEVGDEVFSAKVLGEGIAIEPAEGRLYAPCDGRVDMVFDTKHAVNIVSSDGCEVLLHIGIDTVKLGGKYFESHVEAGQQVRRGDLLVTFDMEKIRRAGYKLTTPMIVGNTEDYGSVTAAASGEVRAGEEAIRIN